MSSHTLPDADGEGAESAFPGLPHARDALRKLPRALRELALECPLCGAPTTLRGLRVRPLRGHDDGQWQVIATCPACGLISAFDIEEAQAEAIEAATRQDGRPWQDELSRFWATSGIYSPAYSHEAGWHHFLGAFTVAFATWLLLTGSLNPADLVWGALACALTARLTYRFAVVSVPDWILQPRRWVALSALTFEFVRQLVVQNITLSLRVFHPRLPIRPGIVAIPTRLRGDVALTLLGSLSTLTPDTVTVDIDERRGVIYVHWIDVRTTDPEEAYRLISARLEQKIENLLRIDEAVPPVVMRAADEEGTVQE